MRGFRPLSRIAHPSLINSYFLGGTSSVNRQDHPLAFIFLFLTDVLYKSLTPVASGTAIQPVYSVRPQQPIAGMGALTVTDHWKLERVVAVAMLAIIPGSFVFDSALMNYLLAASLAVHAHWGSLLAENFPWNKIEIFFFFF